ncbi:CYTH domain-containing protein [Paenibacillus sp. GCM10012307]|uniref:CYTH domain-containing protein n=1 Tax=Paenibacillus roseus TaxID=2798579 RepID=A0A934IZ18_9BACL|nr:CYTH domain-containing protein [Paenibacillus roseus]MBJ6360299.1 CYTH domain-containing protein [Paenibacillus roseus]
MTLEIERKFLLKETVDNLTEKGILAVHTRQRIEQTYLAIDPDQEIRVRKIADLQTGALSYTHTFKRGNGLLREEIEYEISPSIYEQLTGASGAVPLTKDRITAYWNNRIVEIDCYDQLELNVLEVEFASEQEAREFQALEWFGQDITEEYQYSNKTVWCQLQQRR